jgi:hypothetical protein
VKKLFGRGERPAVRVEPPQLLPTGDLTAYVTLPEALDKVAAAKVELGYANTYNYRWAGKADATLTQGADSLANIGEVGTDYGSEREVSDWVAVIATELPLDGGTLGAGSHEVAFRVPSWAPGSSDERLVRWAVRLAVDRKGRDIETDAGFTVLAPAPDPLPAPGPLERVMGSSTDIDIRLDRTAWCAGETLTGTVVITTPAGDPMPEADVAVLLHLDRASHPLQRTPGQGQTYDRDRVQLDKRVTLAPGAATELPFEIPVPADAPPTAEAVHGSLAWYVGVRILYKGFNAHMPERVRRGFVMYNAD